MLLVGVMIAAMVVFPRVPSAALWVITVASGLSLGA
jgi:hypothetical protein